MFPLPQRRVLWVGSKDECTEYNIYYYRNVIDSLAGMTKVKFSKSEDTNTVFLERRRAALERLDKSSRLSDTLVLACHCVYIWLSCAGT